MLKKNITWTDPLTEAENTGTFYFNLSNAEIAEMELRNNLNGGLRTYLQQIIDSNDGHQIMDAFKEIISMAYGVKGSDGYSFVKTKELSAGFLGSEPYSVLFMELITDPDYAAAFINSIVPSSLSSEGVKQPKKPSDHKTKTVKDKVTSNEVETISESEPMEDQDEKNSYAEFLAWRKSQNSSE